MKEKFPIRYKVLKGKKVPLCDYHGTCNNKVHCEVYPFLMGGKYKNWGWNYLCKRHLKEEQKRLKNKLPFCYV
ncbi:MAG: hypothetical protein ABIH25_05265 [Candidatus Woesearchaeota archaeon]